MLQGPPVRNCGAAEPASKSSEYTESRHLLNGCICEFQDFGASVLISSRDLLTYDRTNIRTPGLL